MTDDIAREIARCDDEIARMEAQDGNAPAYLVTLGIEDWRREIKFLVEELKMSAAVAREPERSMSRPHVTPREIQVLNLLADGMNSREIAGKLGISRRTAETHRGRLLVKFGDHSMAAVVRHAIRIGLIDA